jgi:transposase
LKGDKRVPVEVASLHWQPILEGLLLNTVKGGSLKLIKHQNKWYVYLSVIEDVPQNTTLKKIGCDRGQNNLAVVAPPFGVGKFFNGREVMHRRRYFQRRRKQLQEHKKFGLKLIHRPAPYTSKSCSTCGVIGSRKKHDFHCPNNHYHNADLNAARNLAAWDGSKCDLSLKKDVSVMDSSGLNHGLLGTAPNSMNTVKGRVEYMQLSLFDCTYNWTRYENPTALT